MKGHAAQAKKNAEKLGGGEGGITSTAGGAQQTSYPWLTALRSSRAGARDAGEDDEEEEEEGEEGDEEDENGAEEVGKVVAKIQEEESGKGGK